MERKPDQPTSKTNFKLEIGKKLALLSQKFCEYRKYKQMHRTNIKETKADVISLCLSLYDDLSAEINKWSERHDDCYSFFIKMSNYYSRNQHKLNMENAYDMYISIVRVCNDLTITSIDSEAADEELLFNKR